MQTPIQIRLELLGPIISLSSCPLQGLLLKSPCIMSTFQRVEATHRGMQLLDATVLDLLLTLQGVVDGVLGLERFPNIMVLAPRVLQVESLGLELVFLGRCVGHCSMHRII